MSIGQGGIEEYEKIVDTLMFFGDGVSLEFVVDLAWKGLKGERKSYYTEYSYKSMKYDTSPEVVSIKRTIKSALAVYSKKSGLRIIITRSMLDILQQVLKAADMWYSPKSDVFQYKDNKLIVVGEYHLVVPLPQGSGLAFEPISLFEYNMYEKGCRMFLNDSSTFVDFSVDKFKEFLDIVKRIDYYQAACAVINSLPISRQERIRKRVSMDEKDNMSRLFKNNSKNNGNFFDKK